MDLTLTRTAKVADGVFGTLQGSNLSLHTLEHAYESTAGIYYTKVPNGTYSCVRGEHRLASQTHPFETFEITGVPGHTGILFHPGNYNQDSEGCVLLGLEHVGGMVTNSQIAFQKLLAAQQDVNQFTLTVTG